MFKKIIRLFIKKKPSELSVEQAHIIPRAKHNISRSAFSDNSLKVLSRLHKAGYSAYLVGGSIRDLVLGKPPKDFDIATNAHPEDVKKLFSNCLLIGKRFRLAHIRFGRDIIEVATFRSGELSNEQFQDSHGMILRDNMYGTIEQDVMRRDFTLNALYYNIADFSLVDYVNGLQDIQNHVIRMIGDPVTRYKEDPVRMLRAIRFAAKLDFTIAHETAEPIKELAVLLTKISPSRLFEEYMKLFLLGAAVKTYNYLLEYDLLKYLFSSLLAPQDDFDNKFIYMALENTDQRIREDKPLSPAFLLSVFLLPWILREVKIKTSLGVHKESIAWNHAIDCALQAQQSSVAIPRKIIISIREILDLQYKLDVNRSVKKIAWVMEHPRFRAAYDIILLRAQAGDSFAATLEAWWTKYLAVDEEEQLEMLKDLKKKAGRKSKSRFRKSTKGKPNSLKASNDN
jgi:poly(A) polymerase